MVDFRFQRTALLLVLLATLAVASAPVGGVTFCVDNPADLQAALDIAAGNGLYDTVQIVQGIYDGNFVYVSAEATTLTVEGGYLPGCTSRVVDPTNTILDGGALDVVLALVSTGAHAFSLEGVTLRNGLRTGSTEKGAGLFCLTDGSVSLSTNIFEDNQVTGTNGLAAGAYIQVVHRDIVAHNNIFLRNSPQGAKFSTGGDITFTSNVFEDNTETGGESGGVSLHGDSVTFVGNRFVGNISSNALSDGGGARVGAWWSLQVVDNHFSGNSAGDGGGLYLLSRGGPTRLEGNVFDGNEATGGAVGGRGNGGGVMILCTHSGAVSVTSNTFSTNTARRFGGGLSFFTCPSLSLRNNTFDRNATDSVGGGLTILHQNLPGDDVGPVGTTNNSFSGNSAGVEGGGFYSALWDAADTSLDLHNNIFWNNTAPLGADLSIHNDPDGDFLAHPTTLIANDFDQSSGFFSQRPIAIGPTNFNNVDPLFVDGASGDLHLSEQSPVIDGGENGAPDLPPTDKDGCPRIVGGIVDLGAYEYPGAPDGDNLTLMDESVLDTQSYHVCDTITVGPDFVVYGPFGRLNLRAGNAIVFRDGFGVEVDGGVTARVD